MLAKIDPGTQQWSDKWRPAPEAIVDEWRSLTANAKSAVVRTREEVANGKVAVYLTNQCLADAGLLCLAEAIGMCDKLRSVNLQSNGIGDMGAAKITEMVARNLSLQVLCLSFNKIGDQGAFKLAEQLEEHPSLKLLSLDSNVIGDPGASRVAGAISGNPRRDITCVLSNNPVKRFDAKTLENLSLAADTVDDLSELGVTVGQLLHIFTDGCKNGSIIPRSTKTGEVVLNHVIPASRAAQRSYVQAVSPNNAQPWVQVIHAWDGLFEDLVRSVASHACGGKRAKSLDPDSTEWRFDIERQAKTYFIDAFCVNQHAHVNVREYGVMSRFAEHPAFSLGQAGCQIDKLHLVANKLRRRNGRLLLAVDTENLLLTRTSCLHEMNWAIESQMHIDVFFASLRMFPQNMRHNLVQNSEASSDHTRKAIIDDIRDSPGGFDAFNERVLEFFDRHAEAEFEAKIGPV
mmetsp:Transcript_68639/g.147003  ORF Transcript_68639/g.147003 Transcript_68639/m.147003 type:complete len:460 (-) Transcript_68639:131-1510(-)